MKVNLKSKEAVQNYHTSAGCDPDRRAKSKTFQVQTGVQAGGFYDRFYNWWQGVADGFNAADASNTGGL